MKVKINFFLYVMIILFANSNTVFAQQSILEKQITIKSVNKTLPEILKIIEKSDGVKFIYSHNIIPKNYQVNINVENHQLGRVLKSILGRTSLAWKEMDGHIVIYKSKKVEKKVNVPKEAPNRINVINVYDTIVSVKYDTITNFVYDTLMITQYDTVVHEVYTYLNVITNHFSVGLAYNDGVYSNNSETILENYADYYKKSESLTSDRTIYGLFSYKRNRFDFETGLGYMQHGLRADYKYPAYTPVYKDTTVYIEHEYPEYRIEGNETVWYLQTGWIDSTYSFVYDSTRTINKSSEEHRINYLSIPLSIGYSVLQKKKASVYLQTGGIANIKLGEGEKEDILPELFNNTAYSKVFYRYFFGIGFEYLFLPKAYLSASMRYNFELNSKYKNSQANANSIYGLDIRLGIYYRLK